MRNKAVFTPALVAAREEMQAGPYRVLVRADTHDPLILEEHFKRRSYASRLDIRPGDRVLDIGAHIGMFALYAASAGATVTAFEPDPSNYELLQENVSRNAAAVDVYQSAVVGSDGGLRMLYVSQEGRTSCSSFITRRGRARVTVDTIGINEALAVARPRLVKMDCEGAEAEILPAITAWEGVDEFVMEYHASVLRDAELSIYDDLLALLERHFPVVDAPRQRSGAFTRDVHAHQ